MVKTRYTNNQTAFEYALYMIATSYFKTAKCTTKIQEKKLKVQYMEQKLKNQYLMEEICIKHMEKLVKRLPEELFNQEMEVRLIGRNNGEYTEIQIKNENYIFRFKCSYAGEKSKIIQEVLKKTSNNLKYAQKKAA